MWNSHPVKVCVSVRPQFTVECEWQRQESQTVSVAVPHVLSFGEFCAVKSSFTNFRKKLFFSPFCRLSQV